MMLSGLIGIFIGDTALFACLNRMGPRQAGLLFSCHAVFSAILGYFLFSESMTSVELIGSALVFSGVLTAIFFGRRGQSNNQLETIKGTVWIGVALGITAAICQALGGIIAKPVMQTNIDPVAASAIRMITAFVAHSLFRLTGAKLSRALNPMNKQIFAITAVNGFSSDGGGNDADLVCVAGRQCRHGRAVIFNHANHVVTNTLALHQAETKCLRLDRCHCCCGWALGFWSVSQTVSRAN